LLLSSGTATGKTEAAFLPILTALYNKPSHSVGVMYISPLKALINDQFQTVGAFAAGFQYSRHEMAWRRLSDPKKKNSSRTRKGCCKSRLNRWRA
jgi:Lhr-like helicase